MLRILRFGRGRLALKVAMRIRLIVSVFLFSALCAQDDLPLIEIELGAEKIDTPKTELSQGELSTVESPPLTPSENELPKQNDPIDPSSLLVASKSLKKESAPLVTEEGYTINYNTVSILEYLRFASKICNTNFIFNDADLDFTVTVVSDAPITPENVMSTLLQVLRIHGLVLLEQDNNLVIHKATDVRQIATLVTEPGQGGKAAIVTRVFRISNARVDSIAAIIRPMISSGALLEVSPETRQLILTDIRTNVDKVSSLIEILDLPAMPVETAVYEAIHNPPDALIHLVNQIMTPMAQGNPFALVANELSHSIYIITTPELAKKAISIFQIVDVPPKHSATNIRKLNSENVFLYRPLNRGGSDLLKSLLDLSKNLQNTGLSQGDLIPSIESAKWIAESNSLMFVGSKQSLDKIKELLISLDVRTKGAGQEISFFLYRPDHKTASEVQAALNEMTKNLRESKIADVDLLNTLSSAKLNESANSITFSGEEKTFPEVKEILNLIDIRDASKSTSSKKTFFLYKPSQLSAVEIESSLKDFGRSLDKSKAPDKSLIDTINNMQVIANTNAILFTGTDADLKRLNELLPTFDVIHEGIGNQFFIYKVKVVKGDQLAASLKELTETLQSSQYSDPAFLRALQSMKYVKSTNSFLFTGDSAAIKKVEDLISTIDTPGGLKGEKKFIFYEPKYVSREKIEAYFKQLSDNLSKKGGGEDLLVAIRSMKWLDASHSFMIHGSDNALGQVQGILQNFDTPNQSDVATSQGSYFLYKVQNGSAEDVKADLENLTKDLTSSGLKDLKVIDLIHNIRVIKETNSLLLTGDAKAIEETKELIAQYDAPRAASSSSNFFMYKPQFLSGPQVMKSLQDLVLNLKKTDLTDPKLINAIETAKYVESSQSIVFTGSPDTIQKIQAILKDIDNSTLAQPSQAGYFVYKIQNHSAEDIKDDLNALIKDFSTSGLKDLQVVDVIRNMRVIKETNSLFLSGNQKAIEETKELISQYDQPGEAGSFRRSGYFIYKVQNTTGDLILEELNNLAKNFASSGLKDAKILDVIKNIRYVKDTNSLLLTGDPKAIEETKELIAQYDFPRAANSKGSSNFFMYKPVSVNAAQLQKSLRDVAENLKKSDLSDPALIQTILTAKYTESSNTIIFTGSPDTISKVQGILKELDVSSSNAAPSKMGYYIYKVEHTRGDLIEEDLDNLAKNFASSGLKDAKILDVIKNIRYVKETNSLLLTGDQKAIEETKELIAQYDYPRTATSKGGSNFFMYKPQSLTAAQLQKSLNDVAENLKKADLADPSLLQAIQTSKYVETTNSIIFTGTQDTIQKIQSLLKDIDIPSANHTPIQHIGATTFLLYKLKNASGSQIMTSLQNMLADLKKSKTTDKDFLSALGTMKFVRETNSLLFTGDEDSLKKVEVLVEQFDVTSLGAAPVKVVSSGPTDYFLYKPQAVTGPDLEQNLREFADHLRDSGHNDPDLYNAISSSRWVEKTQNLMFTGTPKALDRIKELLKTFDIIANIPATDEFGNLPSIQAIDNTSFLVYKLQFHKGDEIQGALRQIAKDLTNSNAVVNQNLLNSINSLQWLEMTNSLLCSGDNETLTRLRELIKNLDLPLKQVFIEVLVIETTMTNALNFGLEWGTNFNFRNQYSASMFNTAPGSSLSTAPSTFDTNLAKLAPPATPTPQLIPTPAGGFDLGVIGEVIKHNGESYLTLGSLLTALQSDAETSIVMTPKIIAQDGRTATLFQGNNIPFTGSFVTNSSQTTVQTANIEYRDIGMSLTVTPVLGNSDIVTLDINFDQSQMTGSSAGTVQIGGSTISSGLVTSKTNMQTTVHVPDKHFLILTGNVNNSNTKTKSGIPCLGGLPLIGAAFSSTSDAMNNTNIVVFLRPHILTSKDDMLHISKEQEEFFRDQGGSPFLQHNFDEAMDYVKSINDE